MSQNMRKSHYIDTKYQQYVADELKKLPHKVHYKLYMIYTKDGFTDDQGIKHQGQRINQSFLADAMGVSRQQFADYIKVDKPTIPKLGALHKLSRAINIPFEYLVEDTIDYLADPSAYSFDTNHKISANKKLCSNTIKDHLRKENSVSKNKLTKFLDDVGINCALMYRLTDTALLDLTHALKETVNSFLSDENNLYNPVNPIDPDDLE